MNPMIPRRRTDRSPGAGLAARVVPTLGILVWGSLLGASASASRIPTTPASSPAQPGLRVPGLDYFRLEPSSQDTTYRLLVIPVRFPEDRILGGGSAEDLLEKLNGAAASLAAYYRNETGGRLRIVSTVAPTVVALHDRDYYTLDGGGYGIDPDSYPNNAQRLVEEVTAALNTQVDFRLFDNTQDGIADGLLILHSGPESSEEPGFPFPADVLLAHSFTVSAVLPRGGSSIFPYALAATRDGLGVWAHEVGHLFGLPDLYVASGICPGPGLGEWSLMATGANRGGGDNPTGLDAFSRQLLGIQPVTALGTPVSLSGRTILKAADPGAEAGSRYYLVESRAAGDGPSGQVPARVIYAVDEGAIDNRSCPLGGSSYRPLVRVAFVACPGQVTCSTSFQESCTSCPQIAFDFSGDEVRATPVAIPPVRVARVALTEPTVTAGLERQRVVLTLESVHPSAVQTVTVEVLSAIADSVCVEGPLSWALTLNPGESQVDSTLALVSCLGSGSVPREDLSLRLELHSDPSGASRADTLLLPAQHVGVSREDWEQFSLVNLAPGRRIPWSRVIETPPGCDPQCPPPETTFVAGDLDRLARGELLSPWFTVPTEGSVVLDHTWDLSALAADVALDGGRVLLRTQTSSDLPLVPPGGWGFTAERSIGNGFGGLEVLSGQSARSHVFDLSPYRGEAARLVLAAAGDAEISSGDWTVREISVRPAPAVFFRLEENPAAPGQLRAVTTAAPQAGIAAVLYRGLPAVHPTTEATTFVWNGAPVTELGSYVGGASRFELLWLDGAGKGGTVGATFLLPIPDAGQGQFLLLPRPNPVRRGTEQVWGVAVPEGGPWGWYRFRLIDLTGGVVTERSLRIDVAGTREIPWDGRDQEGRSIPSGVYFLEAQDPQGAVNSRHVVVVP